MEGKASVAEDGLKEADWTPTPHVERETASLRRRSRLEGKVSVWLAGLTSVGAIGSAVASVQMSSPASFALDAAFCLACAAATAWLARRDNDLVDRVSARDRARRDEFGRDAGWIVDLLILQGAAPTGADRGMLWVEEGRLCFSGDRTSFALAADQVAGRCRPAVPVSGLAYPTLLRLRHRTPAGPLALSIRMGEFETGVVRGAIDHWAGGDSKGGQLPPTRRGPGAIPAKRLFAYAWFSTVYWLIATGAFLASITIGVWTTLVTVVLVALAGLVLRCFPVIIYWCALRDGLRLRRTE